MTFKKEMSEQIKREKKKDASLPTICFVIKYAL